MGIEKPTEDFLEYLIEKLAQSSSEGLSDEEYQGLREIRSWSEAGQAYYGALQKRGLINMYKQHYDHYRHIDTLKN